MEELVGGREDQVVLFGGTSAGGRGSMVDLIINHDQISIMALVFTMHKNYVSKSSRPSDQNFVEKVLIS